VHVTHQLGRVARAAVLVVALTACTEGGDPEGEDPTSGPGSASESAESAEAEPPVPPSEAAAARPSLPPDGEPGSLSTMATQPAATAAGGNPNLTTLVQAVGAAGLVDTLDGPGPFTVFAPVNEAFAAIPPAELEALLADPEQLTALLTYHVVQGQALQAGDLSTMQEVTTTAPVTLAPEGETVSLNDGQATVVYPDIQVANGVVHLIDGVLRPPAAG